jgi:beta-lactamase class A
LRTHARPRSAALIVRWAVAALACCLAAALCAAGYTLMSRAAPGHPGRAGRRPHDAATANAADSAGRGNLAAPPTAHPSPQPGHACPAHAALLAALAPVLAHRAGRLAVGITDLSTGVTATYHSHQAFHTASIVKADILATLLLQLQRQHAGLSLDEQDLATAMIEESDNGAAAALWNIIGATPGLAAGDQVLRLRHTVPGVDGYWGLTSTTVTDQLRLLSDLTSRHGPLTGASRRYELGLMRSVEPGQNWGVPAAAGRRTQPAVKNGWMPDGPLGLWDINSIGAISHHGQRLLIAVLSSEQPAEQGGIDQVQAAAMAAAAALTRPACARGSTAAPRRAAG